MRHSPLSIAIAPFPPPSWCSWSTPPVPCRTPTSCSVDAGEIGAGHDVTALYELTMVGSGGDRVDPLRYARRAVPVAKQGSELGWLRLRYKSPAGGSSRLMERALAASTGGTDRWGYRAEFLTLVDRARSVTQGQSAVAVSP